MTTLRSLLKKQTDTFVEMKRKLHKVELEWAEVNAGGFLRQFRDMPTHQDYINARDVYQDACDVVSDYLFRSKQDNKE